MMSEAQNYSPECTDNAEVECQELEEKEENLRSVSMDIPTAMPNASSMSDNRKATARTAPNATTHLINYKGNETSYSPLHNQHQFWKGNFSIHPNEYIQKTQGTLPLVLSAPHGGHISPNWVPNLKFGTQIGDAHTIELTNLISSHIAKLTGGRRPFVVLNLLSRRKMDPNRDINKGTEGGEFASAAYKRFHDCLVRACVDARRFSSYSNTNMGGDSTHSHNHTNPTDEKILLIDIHGYSPLPSWNATTTNTSWVMVGHLLSTFHLRKSDARLNQTCTGWDSSSNHRGSGGKGLANAEWIRGETSMGSLLEKRGIMAEPSTRQKIPHEAKYFSGGYITKTYRSGRLRREGIRDVTEGEEKEKPTLDSVMVDTMQLEFPRPMRDDIDNVAPKVAESILEFLYVWGYISS